MNEKSHPQPVTYEARRRIYISTILATTVGMFLLAGIPTWLFLNLEWGLGMAGMSAGVMAAGARVTYREEAYRKAVAEAATASKVGVLTVTTTNDRHVLPDVSPPAQAA